MKNLIILAFVATVFSACIDIIIAKLDDKEMATLASFQAIDDVSQLKITEASEPGQAIWLCLTFIGKESKRLLPYQKVHFYHTSTKGEYEPSNPSDESTARLNGYASTNGKGQLLVQTILPGDYGSSADNRHIHTTVENAHPEAYDIHFKQYTTFMGRRFNAGSDQHFLADLKQAEDGTLVAFLTIEVKNTRVEGF